MATVQGDGVRLGGTSKVSVNAPELRTLQGLTEGDQHSDGLPDRIHMPLPSPPVPESPTSDQLSSVPVSPDSGSDTDRPIVPPRPRHPIDYRPVRGKLPAPPPPESTDRPETSPHDGGWSGVFQALQARTAVCDPSVNELEGVHVTQPSSHSYRKSWTEQSRMLPVVPDVPSDTEEPPTPVDHDYETHKESAIYQHKYQEIPLVSHAPAGHPTMQLDGASTPENISFQSPAALHDLPVKSVPEPSFESRGSPTSQSRSTPVSPDCGTDAAAPDARNPTEPVYGRHKLPVPLPDQSHSDYSEVAVPVEEPTLAAVHDLSVQDVADHLREIHLDQFVDVFQQNGVDGTLLSNMDEQMLQTEFEMSRFQARKLMLSVKQGWRPNTTDIAGS